MAESLKFGPEWLRNTISTSPTKQEEVVSRPILSESRYSREEMLSFCESIPFKADPHSTYTKIYHHNWQTPLAFHTEEREKERSNPPLPPIQASSSSSSQARLFINSNMKNGNWRKQQMVPNEERNLENWRTQKDSGHTGVFYNNSFNDQQHQHHNHHRRTSWRNPENTTENLLEQQKSPPEKYPENSVVTNKSPPAFNSPMNNFIEQHLESQEVVKNYMIENNINNSNGNSSTSTMTSLVVGARKAPTGSSSGPKPSTSKDSSARQLFASDSKANGSCRSAATTERDASERIIDVNLRKLEIDLVKNLTDLVISSEEDFNNGGSKVQMSAPQPAPPVNIIEKPPPIAWCYIDPNGKIQGPFTEEQMTLWYENSFFHENLMVKRSIDNSFIPLGSLIKIYGSAHPFTVASNYFPIPRVENYFDQFHPNHSIQQQQQQPQPSTSANMNIDSFNQMNYMPYKQAHSQLHQQQQQQQQPQMNFLAQPFPTIKQTPLLPTPNLPNFPQLDRRSLAMNYGSGNKTLQYAQNQQQPQPAMPSLNFNMNLINFQAQKQQQANNFKPALNLNSSNPIQTHQIPLVNPRLDSSNTAAIDSIQRMLFDIQKHEYELQQQQQHQKMNFFQPPPPPPPAPVNSVPVRQSYASTFQNQTIMSQASNNSQFIPQQQQQQQQQQEEQFEIPPRFSFDADDEGEFQKVQSSRRRRFQKEEVAEATEKAKTFGAESFKALSVTSIKSNGDLNDSAMPKKPAQAVVEERSTQPTTPAPWFKQVVVTQSDDKNINNIHFTFAECSNVEPVPWPKIKSPPKKDDDGGMIGMNGEKKSMAAPWVNKNATGKQNSSDEKSLKKIQIEQEEIRQIELQVKREKEKVAKELEKKKDLSKPMWKPVNVAGEKESDVLPLWSAIPVQSTSSNQKKEQKHESSDKIELESWCVNTLKMMNIANIDIHAFTSFLLSIESPFEIEDYIKVYLGDNLETSNFLKKFLHYRSTYYNNINNHKQQIDDLCAPAKAINPISSSSSTTSSVYLEEKRKNGKKKNIKEPSKRVKRFTKVVDSNILGFRATADPNRIVGELDMHNFVNERDE